MVNCQ